LRKGDTYEGGVRVPFLVRQPGVVRQGVSSELVSSLDLLPTIAARLGITPPNSVDGVDLNAHLANGLPVQRDCLLYFNGNHLQCIRRGNWKLHLSRFNTFAYNPAPAGGRLNLPLAQPELYNLTLDPAESYDVAGRHPEVVRELAARAEQMIAGFPEPVRAAWAETGQRRSAPQERGSLPRARQN
jgi:arylsulfatase A-like enzyme